jgi:uncharacterized protein (DUF2235 family)
MPLYAFDGTWNADKPGADQDTNVLLFRQAYDGHAKYLPGVGTRFKRFGAVVGGMTGAGGRTRIREMKQALLADLEAGRTDVDIVGFSRGAALAVHFANVVAGLPDAPPIRFLGIWDCVPSFGLPSVGLNLGWDLDLPDSVEKCFHALALDERRHTFRLHRLDANVERADQEGRLFEVWFRGVHSDVGGGNKNTGLSAVSLRWMLTKAVACGLPITAGSVETSATGIVPGCKVSEAPRYDLIKNRRRTVRWNDQVHSSVTFVDGCNNPSVGLAVVDDDGEVIGQFPVAS